MKILKTASYKKIAEDIPLGRFQGKGSIGCDGCGASSSQTELTPLYYKDIGNPDPDAIESENYCPVCRPRQIESILEMGGEIIESPITETKPARPGSKTNTQRTPWDAEGDFNQRLTNEFSGEAANAKDDALDDKWNQLFNKNKKRQPAFAMENNMKILKTASYKKMAQIGSWDDMSPETSIREVGDGDKIKQIHQDVNQLLMEENEDPGEAAVQYSKLSSQLKMIRNTWGEDNVLIPKIEAKMQEIESRDGMSQAIRDQYRSGTGHFKGYNPYDDTRVRQQY